MGQSRPLFVYFRPFLITTSKIQIERSLDGVLGIWTHGCRMVSADEPRSYGGRPMKTIVISAFKYITYEWSLFLFCIAGTGSCTWSIATRGSRRGLKSCSAQARSTTLSSRQRRGSTTRRWSSSRMRAAWPTNQFTLSILTFRWAIVG